MKRFLSIFLSICVLLSTITAIPFFANAVEESDPGYEVILDIKPEEFSKIEGSGGGGKTGSVQSAATIDGTVIRLDAIANEEGFGGAWHPSKYSNLHTVAGYELPTEGTLLTNESGILCTNRGDVRWGSDLASPASGPQISPIYGGKTVNVGDTIKITALVRVHDLVEYGTKTVLADQTTPVDIRMWAYDPWKSNSNPGYNTAATVEDISFHTTIVADEWTELVLEYEVTEENKGVTAVSIDNKTAEGNPYPMYLYFAGAKIEKKPSPDATPTPEPTATPVPTPTPDPNYDMILNVDPNLFSKIEGSGGAGKKGNVLTEATIDGTVVKLNTIANAASTAGHWATSMYSNHGKLGAFDNISLEGTYFTGDSGVMWAHRGDVQWGSDLATPASGMYVEPVYGGKTVNVGDKIRITAWVYADNIVEYGTKTHIDDQTTPVDVRMWAYDPWVSNADPGYNTKATVEGISLNTTMVADTWTKLVLEYTVTEENKGVTALCIDNKTDSPNPYPLDFYFAGATIEKFIDPDATPTPAPTATPAPTPTPDPNWNVLLDVDPTDFAKIEGSGGGGNNGNVLTQATIDGTVVKLNTIANAASTANHWATSKYSNLGLLSAYSLPTEGAPYVGEEAKVIFAHRGDVQWGGDLASPASGIYVEPVYGGKTVNAGDKIRITAWVYADDIVEYGTKTQIADQTTPVDVRMWAYDPWVSNADPGYNTNATVEGISLNTTMVSDQWTELVLEYTVTEENKGVTALCIDNKTDEGNPYPLDFYFAGAKIEKFNDPDATPTPAPTATPAPTPTPDPNWNVLLDVDPTDFAKIEGSGGGGNNGNVLTEATIDGTVVKLNTIANAASTSGNWYTSKYSNLGLLDAYELPKEGTPFTSEKKVIFAHRGDVKWGGDLASPASGIYVEPVYGGKTVNVGDKIRITAWVYADDIVEYGTKTLIADQTTPVDVRMWAYDPWVSNADPGYNTKATVEGISLNTTMVSDQWTELVLEYTVTEENKGVTALCIDNKTDEGNPYPLDFYFAGAKIEKFNDPDATPEPTPTATPEPIPTPTPDPNWDILLNVKPEEFSKVEGSGGGGKTGEIKSEAIITGTTVKLNSVANEAGFGGAWAPSKYSNLSTVASYELPTEGTSLTSKSGILCTNRGDVRWGGDLATPATGPQISPLTAGKTIRVGDTIKITALVRAHELVEYGTKTAIEDQTQPVDIRMWVSRPWVSNNDPGYNNGGVDPELTLSTKIVTDQWTELVLEYTVTEENIQVDTLSIDNKTAEGNPYPMYLYFAGVTIAKEKDPNATPEPDPTPTPTPSPTPSPTPEPTPEPTMDPATATKVKIGKITTVEKDTYYEVSVPYTIENWRDGANLGVIVYNVTDVLEGEEAPYTHIANITQAPADENGAVLTFKLPKKTEGSTDTFAFTYSSTMLVKIGSNESVVPASKTYTFPMDPALAPQFKFFKNEACTEPAGRLEGTIYVNAANTEVEGTSLMVGIYNSKDMLIGFKKVDNAAVCGITIPAECSYIKAFLWDSDMKPVLDAVKK